MFKSKVSGSCKSNSFFGKKSKKGFGDAVSTLIMFIAVISVTTGIVVVFKNYVTDTQDSFNVQNKLTSSKLRTSIGITNIYYNDSSNTTYIYVKNLGETKLKTSLFDVFIDDSFQDNFNIYYANDISKNMSVFNPQETLVIVKQIDLSSGSHEVKVLTEYGVGDEDFFNN